jgi:hypothetical protein
MLMSVVVLLTTVGIPVEAASKSLSNNGNLFTMKVVTVKSVSKGKDEYSDWIRATGVEGIKRAWRNGEKGYFDEKVTIKTTSSIEATLPIKQLSAKLGYTVEKSVSRSFRSDVSAPLKKGESTAFYYRNHYKVYTVDYIVKEYSGNKLIKQYCKTSTIKVAQKYTPLDYGWFYTKGSYKKLKATLSKKIKPGSSL